MKSARDMQRITPKKHDSSAYTLRNALHIALHFFAMCRKAYALSTYFCNVG